MAVEGRRGADLDARVDPGNAADNSGQIALQMKPEREKVRHHYDAGGSFLYHGCNGGFEVRRTAVEKRGFNQIKSTFVPH